MSGMLAASYSPAKNGAESSSNTVMAHPPSPALNREQIKNRSSRGWSGSSNSTATATAAAGLIPPLNFKSRQATSIASVGMAATLSSESGTSSTVDGGSPFGSILAKFDNPPTDNARKSSGSFKVLDKKAVSNSPFLTGGNTTSSTSASPQTTRRPFAPNAFGHSWSNGNSPASSPNSGKHGLGLFARSTPASQSPVQTINSGQFPSRVPHKRTNSDIENRDPQNESKRLAQHGVEVLREDKYLSVVNAGKFADAPSPATQFNAEMEAIGGPQAIDVTYATSSSGSDTSPELEQQTKPFSGSAGVKRGPRPSVAALGNRNSVSSSPFLQQGLPKPAAGTSGICQATSSLRKGMGPREPSNPDLRAQYADDEALPRLTEAALERKASKKSVKWAEVEEVCEFDVLTEDGESRRSSAASSTNTADDYYSNYVGSYTSDEDEEELDHLNDDTTARLQSMPGVQEHLSGEEQFYNDFRHSSTEPEAGGALRREMSGIHSEQASFVDLHPGDNSTSSSSDYHEHEDNEVQRLIDEVEAASLQSRTSQPVEDVFTGEFGTRTPHSSTGSALSYGSSKPSTPQPLHINQSNSLSRRPLPSPPVVGLKVQPASPEGEMEGVSGMATADNCMLLRAGMQDSEFSLPDIGFSNSPLLTFDELGLARKESLKRASPKMIFKKSASPSLLSQEVLMDNSALLRDQDETIDLGETGRSTPTRPQITMEEVRDSLRKRPNSLFANFAPGSDKVPLSSTPPAGPAAISRSNLPTPTNSAVRASKAISARPAPAPVKISSEQLPTLRSSTPSPVSPTTKEPESALDRLVREAADSNGLLHAPLLNGRPRSNSSGSSSSGHSFQTADSRGSDGKEALKRHNDALIAAKRKAKGLSAEVTEAAGGGLEVPARPKGRRRSLSTGDADLPLAKGQDAPIVPPKWPAKLETSALGNEELGFSQTLGKALDECRGKGYRVNEKVKGQYLGLSPGSGRISTVGDAGDVDAGGAWRKARRPSDIHEHRTRIKEYKETSASRSRDAAPIVFVKVGKLVFDQRFPIPKEPTYAVCELNNGLEHVVTGAARLGKGTSISQEFELFAHPGLEVTLTFKLRKDPRLDRHLLPQRTMSSQSSAPASPSKHSRNGSAGGGFKQGLRAFLGSPKRSRISRPTSAMGIHPTSVAMMQAPEQPILDYVSSDGEICKVTFKIETFLTQCTARKLKVALMCQQASGARKRLENIAELEVSLFHIPQLHGIEVKSLPQNIEECLTGLEQARRFEETIWEGILTQQGADCPIWKRRMFRLKGSSLLAFNEITHAMQRRFELHKALALEDPEETEPSTPANTAATPSTTVSTPHTGRASRASGHMRTLSVEDEDEPFSTRPNSFRITFDDDAGGMDTVDFFADSAEDKVKWMRHLRPIIRGGMSKLNEPPPQWARSLRALRQDQKAQK